MKLHWLTFVFGIFFPAWLNAQAMPKLYLIAGHGSDHRVFQNVDFSGYDTVVLPFLVPEKSEKMQEYARRMAERVDTTQPFALVGVSIGGMIATEMAEFLNPEALIIIAGAKGRQDLPLRYRFQKYLPIYKLFPGELLKRLTILVQPWFEPGVKNYRELCRDMVLQKPPKLTKRGIYMIMTWGRQVPALGVPTLHLHGPKDGTLPLKCIQGAEIVPDGSHMMTLFMGDEITQLIRPFLAEHFAPPSQR